jgi:hypothetical protein
MTSTMEKTINLVEGIEGNFSLSKFAVTCGSANQTKEFSGGDLSGENTLKVTGTDFSMDVNLSADFNESDFPCIDNEYSFSASGNFSLFEDNGVDIARIEYEEDGNTVFQEFEYKYNNNTLKLDLEDTDGNRYLFTFVKGGYI